MFHALLIEQNSQVDQARAEARTAEAAVGQRIAAALALERADFDKQARQRGNRDVRCTALACFCALCVQQTAWSRFACHAPGSVWIGGGDELQCVDAPDLLMMPC